VPPSPTRTARSGVVEDDGCQITQRQDDRGPWWLALAPLLVVATRRRRK
jgi:MYXO-CTERM domain-containing protein